MTGTKGITGNWKISGLAALGAAALAIPLAAALATPVDPTQPAAAEDVAAVAGPAALTAEQVVQGRQLFQSWSCSACHVLTDANGHGHIGPALDGNATLDAAFIVARVTNGQGAMPGFGGQMTNEEIDLLAAYVVQAKK